MRVFSFLIVITFISIGCFSQTDTKYCSLFQKTIQLYDENTISPIEPEKFDVAEFQNDFLISLDPYSIIFTANDQRIFDLIQKSIHADFNSSYCTLENELVTVYKKNIEGTIEIFKKLKAAKFDFTKKDSIYIGYKSIQQNYNIDKESRCKKYIKTLITQDVLESVTKYDSLKNNKTVLLAYIDSIKVKKINKEIEILEDLLNTPNECQEIVFTSYFNSVIFQYDPYAYLFSNTTYNTFKEQLSAYSNYFGFQLETDKQGDVIIASVIPGSAAWKSGMINPGDKVLTLEKENKASLNLEESEITDIIDFLSGITTEKLTITLLKTDGKVKKIDLYQEKSENIENSVQSFILQGQIKVGYIILPAFYTSWEEQDKFGCAQDVGRAIYLLKKENIQALLIDLRNNAGGSIVEAIDLAGIFVDFGTLSVAQDKYNELTSIKDFNRGTLYSGPMALLVNSNSASASEMVAAVLQDYNRAIVIGDTTFGKSTGQILLPVDNDDSEVLKLTTTKYYRVTGRTYNYTGVIPDIVLPDYNAGTYNGKTYPFPNFSDSIDKKTFYNPLIAIPKESLIKNSRTRTIDNIKFKRLHTADIIYSNIFFKIDYLPLDFENYYKLMQQKTSIDNQIDSVMKLESDSFTIELLPKDKEMIKFNKYYTDLYKQSLAAILADPYIEETLKILTDYTNLKKN